MESHITVLKDESIAGLMLEPRDVVIDATTGQGGHAAVLAHAVGKGGTLVCLDADETSLAKAREVVGTTDAQVLYVHGNFRAIKSHAEHAGITSVDAVLFDLGWHQGQLMSGRGFSFNEDAPLLMTLSAKPEGYQLTAADIIAGWDEEELRDLFKEYGGEKFSGRIARTIVESRRSKPITTARQLADVIVSAVPAKFKKGKIHPATRVFQALRIAVNDEIGALKDGLAGAIELLAPKGRLAVITFHSLEDKVVKDALREAERSGVGFRVNKKVIVPSRSEQVSNPRARSAKLRIFEKNE